MTKTIDIIIAAAQSAGDYLRRNAFSEGGPEWKKAHDPVTVHDRAAERIIRTYLTKHAPGNFVGEEYGETDNGLERTYYLDPIDGTKEWVTRGFQCSTSIGIGEEGELVGGVVHDFMRGISYATYRGESCLEHDGKRRALHVPHALMKRRISVNKNPALCALLPKSQYSTIDKGGSIALELAELAAGNYDAIVSSEIGKGNIWDVAGGTALCRAAGITMRDISGAPFDHRNGNRGVVAIRADLEGEILPYVREAHPNFLVR